MTKNSIIRELATELAKKCVAVRIAETHEAYAYNERDKIKQELSVAYADKQRAANEYGQERAKAMRLTAELNQRDDEIERMRREVMDIIRLNFDVGTFPELHDQIAKALGVPQ